MVTERPDKFSKHASVTGFIRCGSVGDLRSTRPLALSKVTVYCSGCNVDLAGKYQRPARRSATSDKSGSLAAEATHHCGAARLPATRAPQAHA